MNILPKVVFSLPSITKEASTLQHFCAPRPTGWDWSGAIYRRHPDLETALSDVTNSEEIYLQCYKYAKKYRRNNTKNFNAALQKNRKTWEPVEKEFLQTLSDHFEIKYPAKRKVIRGYVSMVPIYPRSLERWDFNVSYFAPEKVRGIACHEIVHFLYFAKWLEVFPNTKKEEMNSPHLVWRLSEILAPVFLNKHPVFKTYFDKKQNTYKEFQKLRIAGKQPTTFFGNIYKKHLASKAPFDEFLKTCWTEAKKHEKILMGA